MILETGFLARAFVVLAGAAARCPFCSYWRGVVHGAAFVGTIAVAVALLWPS